MSLAIPNLGQSFKNLLADPLKKILSKPSPAVPATPVAPTPLVATPIPGRVAGEQGFEITGGGRVSTPTPPASTAPVIKKPISPITSSTPSTFSTPVIPQVKTTPPAPLVNPPGALFDRNTGQPITPVVTSENAPGTTPTAPIAPSATQSADDAALAEYMKSKAITPEEQKAQEELDNLLTNTRLGESNMEGQGRAIPLDLIRGKQAALEKQSLLLAEPLQTKLARIQATRTASIDASKFALDRADKALAAEKDAKKPISGTSFYDPVTGTFKQAPSTTSAKAPEGFTLSPGEIRYDANGKQIASGGAKPMSDTAQSKADDKVVAKQQANTQILSNISLIDEILKNPGAISGPIQTGSIPFTAGATTKNQYDQLKGLLSLDKRALLKGSGAISDFEAKTLDKAASDLGRNQSEKDFVSSLKKLKGVFATAAGLEAPVKVTNPKTGETIISNASRDEINKLIAEGNTVEYQ